jgi:hypothetical protein
VSGVIDAGDFAKEIRGVLDKNPDLVQEVFGQSAKQLARIAEAVSRVSDNPRVDLFDFRDLLTGQTTPTVAAIKELVEKQRKLDEEFSNGLKRSVADGVIPTAQPQKIVDALLNDSNLSNSDVDEIMDLISRDPGLLKRVRTLATMDIFMWASKPSRAADNARIRRGELPELEVVKLREAIGLAGERAKGDPQSAQRRVESILGTDVHSRLVQLTDLLSPRQAKAEISPLGGTLAAGAQTGKLVHGTAAEKVGYYAAKAKAWTLAAIYNTPGLGTYMSNNFWDAKKQAVLNNTIMASTPFVRETIETWGPEVAAEWITAMKEQTDEIVRSLAGQKKQDDSMFVGPPSLDPNDIIKPPPVFK